MDPIAQAIASLRGPQQQPGIGAQPPQQGGMPPEMAQLAQAGGGGINFTYGPDGLIDGANIGRIRVQFIRDPRDENRIRSMKVMNSQQPADMPPMQPPPEEGPPLG